MKEFNILLDQTENEDPQSTALKELNDVLRATVAQGVRMGIFPPALKEDFLQERVLRHPLFQFIPENGVIIVNGERQVLTTTQTRLLRFFMRNPNVVLSREELTHSLSSSNDSTIDTDLRTINVHIYRIRSKMGFVGNLKESPIQARKGFGYVLIDSSIQNDSSRPPEPNIE